MGRYSSASRDAGLALRMLAKLTANPLVSIFLAAILAAAAGRVASRPELLLFGALILPWLFLALFLLNLPFLGAAKRWFKLNEATRCNHALEHGTIYLLRKRYGRRRKLSGESSEVGFRVAGAASANDIRSCFDELVQRLKQGKSQGVVAPGCGSNICTAQAFGLILFTLAAVGFLFMRPSESIVTVTILGLLAATIIVRYPIGMLVQRRRFVSLAFEDASIVSIAPVDRAEPFERHPVFMVRTRIS